LAIFYELAKANEVAGQESRDLDSIFGNGKISLFVIKIGLDSGLK
jgi:hypothetical protein